MKKWFSFIFRIMFFIFIPLTMAWTCYACETYGFTIVIAAGEGTTEPPPGTHTGYSSWGNEETIQAIPAEGWHVEKIVKKIGLDEYTYEYESPGNASVFWHPRDDEPLTIYEVYFAKDESTVTLELLAKLKPEDGQSSLDAISGGGDVTCYADPPYTFPAGSTVKLSCNPKEGYKFERWDIYSKNDDGAFSKTKEYAEVEPTITVDYDTKAVAVFSKT